MKKFAIFIPARYKSSRFPGKPLAKINKKEMLLWVYEKCNKTYPEKVFVLTDDTRITKFCIMKKIPYYLTSKKCKTGTDRIIEISKKLKLDYYINVQGDEPLIEPKNIKKFVRNSLKLKTISIAKSEIDNKSYLNRNIPKIVTNNKNELMYISRAPLPGLKIKLNNIKIYGQVNLYCYPHNCLKKKYQNKKENLEKIEDIEILRFLEKNYKINVVLLDSNNHPVDIPADIKIVEKILSKRINN